MSHWLATTRTVQRTSALGRFDAIYWTVNFPRPAMAAVTTTAADALRVDCVFYGADDLVGLIWASEDTIDHPLLRYDPARDYRHCSLAFRWASSGVIALDAPNGPTLTIEGRDAGGSPRTWYVRLWNYATGTPTDAAIELDFAVLDGGYHLPADADPVWAGDVDRMFISLVAPGYTGTATPFAAPVEGWAAMSGIICTGPGSVLTIGDIAVPAHRLGIASGYDDSYNMTPARLLRQALALGYRGEIVHYVGMSHYFRLEANGGGWYASLIGGVLNAACAAWHRDFAARAASLGFGIIWSVSYELFDAHCWGDWKQRSADGVPALTGWVPPSTLLSPAHPGAMSYLHQVAAAFVGIGAAAGLTPRFQVGEPWWWLTAAGGPCLYDAAAVAAFAPVPIASVRGPLTPAQLATLDAAGACLAASTAALVAAVRAVAPGCVTYLLLYLPTVFDGHAPELRRALVPSAWASPAFDVLQLEDYDWVTGADPASSAGGAAAMTARLGYAPARQEYLSGFVASADRAAHDWPLIDAAADVARARGVSRAYIWALPQAMRDGFVHFDLGGDAMDAFDDVLFPLALGAEAEVAPGFSTAILTSAGGAEQRVASWAAARTRYDVGPGIRAEADIATLLAFYRARMGPARGFRLRDPFDSSATAEPIGLGDGTTRSFALVKGYDGASRRITRPQAGTVTVDVDGVPAGFALEPAGIVTLDTAPAAGADVTASFGFDVPVRFADDSLAVSRATYLAGTAHSVPLIEVREA